MLQSLTGSHRRDSSDSGRPTIWLAGSRAAAVAAAERLDLDSLVLDPTSPAVCAHIAVERARRFASEKPDGIVAVTEAAVPFAAKLNETFGTPGISPAVARLCADKVAMKQAATEAGIPVARWIAVSADTTVEEVIATCGLPTVVKNPIASGSRGVRICRTTAELSAELAPGKLCESMIHGVEMSVESLIQWGRCAFRNYTRYLVPGWASIVPADLSRETREELDSLIDRVHSAFHICTGMTHAEVFLTEEGIVFGEIAARPPGGRLMDLIQNSYEFDPWAAVLRIALGHPVALPRQATSYNGVWFLHPGEGMVRSVTGIKAARRVPGVNRVNVRTKPGRLLKPRLGTGQSVGEVYASGRTNAACEDSLKAGHNLVKIRCAEPNKASRANPGVCSN